MNKKDKMRTVRYYNEDGRYMGWSKYNLDKHVLDYICWLGSGNTIRMGDKVFTGSDDDIKLLVLRKGYLL